jgi:hypothetical protein
VILSERSGGCEFKLQGVCDHISSGLAKEPSGAPPHLPCQISAQVVCRSHKLSATRTSRLPAAQSARTAAQLVGRAHRSAGRPHRLSGLSHSLRDERTSGRTRAQRAGTRPQVVCHAHSLPDTRTARLTTRTSSRTRAQGVCHAHRVHFPHAGVLFPPAGVIFRRRGASCRTHGVSCCAHRGLAQAAKRDSRFRRGFTEIYVCQFGAVVLYSRKTAPAALLSQALARRS